MARKGMDVSYANGSIDWSQVKSSGIEFAILRSTFGSDSDSQIDNQFYQNAQGCVKNNIPFGTYHFAYFVNEKTAKAEADFAIRIANEYKDYVKFIVLDVEEDSVRYAKSIMGGAEPNWTACAIAFMERVKENGYIPVLYSNWSWLKYIFDYNRLQNYKLWYAAPDAQNPAYPCSIWQYSWTGRVNGMIGDVDMDYLYDDSLFFVKNTSTSSGTTTKEKSTESKQNTTSQHELTEVNSSAVVDYSVKVTAYNGINIRTGASVTRKIIGAVPYNTTLNVTRQTGGGGYTWGLITYDGVTGWVALDYTKKADDVVILKKGDAVKVKSGATVYGTNQPLSNFVYQATFKIMEIANNRVVIGINGQVTTAVDKKYLTKV